MLVECLINLNSPTLLSLSPLAPPQWNLTIYKWSEHRSWPRTTTTLTYFVPPAYSNHGRIKKYDVFAVFYGRANPDNEVKRQAVRMVEKPIKRHWSDTLSVVDGLPIVYLDKTLKTDGEGGKLEVTIGGDDQPLRPGCFYRIYLRAYTTVCDIKLLIK